MSNNLLNNDIRNQLAAETYSDEITKSHIQKIIKSNSDFNTVPEFELCIKTPSSTYFVTAYPYHTYRFNVPEAI